MCPFLARAFLCPELGFKSPSSKRVESISGPSPFQTSLIKTSMSLDDLKNTTNVPASGSQSPSPRKRSFSWLLPVGLVLGFLLIFGLLFGNRLIPATEVKTAPVITIRSGETDQLPLEKKDKSLENQTTGKGQLPPAPREAAGSKRRSRGGACPDRAGPRLSPARRSPERR